MPAYWVVRTAYLRTRYWWVSPSRMLKRDLPNHPLRQDWTRYATMFAEAENNFADIVGAYIGEIKWPLGRIYNGLFQSVDCELYYCVVRRFRPRLIIEVGSGNSAWFARDAVKRNQIGRVIAIDPEPRINLPRDVEHVRSRVEEVPVRVFEELGENDVLFFDSSHTTAEATYHIERILPALHDGVLIHHHDISFPYDYYPIGEREEFGESDVILRYYLKKSRDYRVATGAAFVWHTNVAMLGKLVRSFRYWPSSLPTSLWAQKLSMSRGSFTVRAQRGELILHILLLVPLFFASVRVALAFL